MLPDSAKEDDASESLISGQKISSAPDDSGIVRDSSLGPVPSTSRGYSQQKEDSLAGLNQIENSLEQLQSDTTVGTEAFPLLQSIQKDVKTLGNVLTAFIASEHQFRRQMCNDMTAIKELLGTEQSRSLY